MDETKAYETGLIWLPKTRFNVKGLKAALSFTYGSSEYKSLRAFRTYVDGEKHLGVPRHFLDRKTIRKMGVEIVDRRPLKFDEVDVYSKIELDRLRPDRTLQSDAVNAAETNEDGIISLACVTGDTVININRAGKGSRTTVEWAYRALRGCTPRKWDLGIPTNIRSFLGERIGLNRVIDVCKVGVRPVFLVELEDGKRIKITSDHEVLTLHGYRSIDGGLAVGSLVVTDSGQVKWGKKEKRERKKKPVYRRLNWYRSHPFVHLNGTKRGRHRDYVLEEHRAVYEATLNGLTLEAYRDRCRQGDVQGLNFVDPSKFDVHHIDGNHRNNNPENLKAVSKTDHHGDEHAPDPKNFGYGIPTLVPVVRIEPAGEEIVYDVACQGPHHNFVANGIVVHNCGNGKTLVGLHIWAQRRVPLIVVTDQTSILEQWAKMIRLFISPSDLPVGRVYTGRKEWDRPVVLASVQSVLRLVDKGFPEELSCRFGMVIYDETHVLGAPHFCQVAPLFMGQRLGLSATPTRTDRLETVFQYHLGPVIYQDLSQPLKAKFYFWRPKSTQNLTEDPSFRRRITLYGELNVQKLWTALADEDGRTREIADLVRRYGQNRRTLVISQRKELLRKLQPLIPGSGIIVSQTSLPERDRILAENDVVLGIMGIAQKGLDSPTLSLLVLCEPFKDENLFQQVIGRVLREHPNKSNPVVIIVQDNIGAGGGPIFGLCRRLKRIITTWPPDKGGPYEFEDLDSG